MPDTEEERKERVARFDAMIERWLSEPDDDPPGAYAAAMRGIDEERRRLGMRPIFNGRLSKGKIQTEIAARFGVARPTIEDIHSGKTWRHVA